VDGVYPRFAFFVCQFPNPTAEGEVTFNQLQAALRKDVEGLMIDLVLDRGAGAFAAPAASAGGQAASGGEAAGDADAHGAAAGSAGSGNGRAAAVSGDASTGGGLEAISLASAAAGVVSYPGPTRKRFSLSDEKMKLVGRKTPAQRGKKMPRKKYPTGTAPTRPPPSICEIARHETRQLSACRAFLPS